MICKLLGTLSWIDCAPGRIARVIAAVLANTRGVASVPRRDRILLVCNTFGCVCDAFGFLSLSSALSRAWPTVSYPLASSPSTSPATRLAGASSARRGSVSRMHMRLSFSHAL